MPENDISLAQLEQLQADRYINSLFSMWNSLIILNGLIISSISILYLINTELSKFITLTIFFLSSIAILFFIWNYHRIRMFYVKLNKLNPANLTHLSDEEFEKRLEDDKKNSPDEGKWIRRRERIATIITFVNLVFFMIAIAFN